MVSFEVEGREHACSRASLMSACVGAWVGDFSQCMKLVFILNHTQLSGSTNLGFSVCAGHCVCSCRLTWKHLCCLWPIYLLFTH